MSCAYFNEISIKEHKNTEYYMTIPCTKVYNTYRARICKGLRSPGFDAKELIFGSHLAWWAGKTTLFDVWPAKLHKLAESIPKRLQIRAQARRFH
jgi:hypothetical protein